MNIRDMIKKGLLLLSAASLFTAPTPAFAKVSQLQGKEYASVGIDVTRNNQTFNDTISRIGAGSVSQENIVVVDGNMIHRYLNDGSNQSTQVYSSSHVKFNNYESGVTVDIVTPQNIQLVTQATYVNAAITSGIQNANITVGSEVPVTGEGALVGIYAIMEREGVLEPEDAQVAQEEIALVTEATNEAGVEENAMNAMMADVKAEVAQLVQDGTINNVQGDQSNVEGDQTNISGDQNNTNISQTTIEGDQNNNYGTINNIVNVAMNEYGLNLPEGLVNQITQYLMNYATTESAQSPETLTQLGALANDLMSQGGNWLNNVSNEAQAKWNDEQFQLQAQGFFSRLSNGLNNFFSQLGQFLSGLFNSVNVEDLNYENPVTQESIEQPTEQTPAEPADQQPVQEAAPVEQDNPAEAPINEGVEEVAPVQ